MKCREAGTDRVGGVSVVLGTKMAKEYNEHVAEDGALCCYIVAEDTNRILLSLDFEGTTTQFYIDVIIDGVFRYCHRGSHYNQPRTYKHMIQHLDRFETAYCEEDTEFYPARMGMAALDTEPKPEIKGYTGVGSIEFRFSVVRKAEKEHDPYGSATAYLYDNKSHSRCAVGDSACLPTHEIRFAKKVEEQYDKYHSTPCTKGEIKRLRKNTRERRPGPKPWCVFRYYYRSKEVIEKAGWDMCSIWRGPHVLDIEPVNLHELASACPQDSDNVSVASDAASVPPNKSIKNDNEPRPQSLVPPSKSVKSQSTDPCPGSKFKAINSKPTPEVDVRNGEDPEDEAQNEDDDDEEPRNMPEIAASIDGPSNDSALASTAGALSPLVQTKSSGIESPRQASAMSKEPHAIDGHAESEDESNVKHEIKSAKPKTPPTSREETSIKPSTPSPGFKRQFSGELGSPAKRTRATPTTDSLRKQIAEKEKALTEQRARNVQAHERSQKAQELLGRKRLEEIERQLEEARQEEEDYDNEVAEYEEWKELTDSEMEI